MALEVAILNIPDLLDAFWVGRQGSAALAAVTMSMVIRWFANSVAYGLGTGGLAVVSRRIGAQDREAASQATAQTIILGLLLCVVLSVLGLLLARPILQLMGADAEVLPLGLSYLRVSFLASFTWVLLYVVNPMLRGAGDAGQATRGMMLAALVMVITQPILIPRFGVAGSAAAYMLGFGCGLLLQLIALFRNQSGVGVELRHFRPDLRLMGRIVTIALPNSLQMALRSAATMTVIGMVGSFGTYATAGYGLAERFMMLLIVPCSGLGNTSSTLVGQNLGARQPKRATRCAWWVSGYAAAYLLTLTILLFLFAEPLVALFDPTAQVVTVGVQCIRIIVFSIVIDGIGLILGRGLDGAGNTKPAAVINLLTLWALQIPVAYLLAKPLGLGVAGVCIGRALSNVANGSLNVIVFSRGRWQERQV